MRWSRISKATERGQNSTVGGLVLYCKSGVSNIRSMGWIQLAEVGAASPAPCQSCCCNHCHMPRIGATDAAVAFPRLNPVLKEPCSPDPTQETKC
ncbi:hypothetical protein Y1Q_0023474 [Alligator mississippiensis]|uniref:Uncharacterized protein n=1 Tax=Alligator mississippiensis TaxID=8496 RepID=A0A151NPN8_ALLMI|nr:hypothetical protein Y1Q_0023474 [Alligator mississippiensis]